MSGSALKQWRVYVPVAVLGLMVGAAGAVRSVTALALLGALVLGLVLVANAQIASPLLVVLAIPMARPNVLGESLSPVAAGLVLVAAVLAVLDDRGRLQVTSSSHSSLRSVGLWLAIAYAWLLVRTGFVGFDIPLQPLLQSVVLVVGVVAAVPIIVANPKRRHVFAWGFVALVLIQCASYAMTLLFWSWAGVGTGLLGQLPEAMTSFRMGVYFPGTITTGVQTVLGNAMPRFTGIGREPGWMAMWCAFTYFLIPRLTRRRMRFARALLLLGLLGTFSTAGFGVFLVVWTFEAFLRPRSASLSFGYLRQVTGIAVMTGAVWLAIKAPVLGLQAKGTSNALSLSDRSEATRAGLLALQTSSMMGSAGGGQSGINLIAVIAVVGLPFSVAVLAAFFMPLRTHPDPWLALAPVAVLALTLLTSQPPLDSTWVYVAAVLAYAVTLTPPGHPEQRWRSRTNLTATPDEAMGLNRPDDSPGMKSRNMVASVGSSAHSVATPTRAQAWPPQGDRPPEPTIPSLPRL